jgi:ParB-like chromosome segregation protein Spo0J
MKVGLLHPIIINEKGELITGLRRIYACRNIGWSEIEARIMKVDNDLAKLEIEAHENLLRKDFNQAEIELIIKKRKELMKRGFFHRIWMAIKKFFEWLVSLFTKKERKKHLPYNILSNNDDSDDLKKLR